MSNKPKLDEQTLGRIVVPPNSQHELHSRDDGQVSDNVLRRRKYHIASAQWLAKLSYPLQGLFAAIGFFIVLLPVLSKTWKDIVESIPFLAWIFNEFSTLGAVALILLFSMMVPMVILDWMVKHHPGGWNTTREWGFPSPRQVVEKQLYPRTRKEEFVFWVSEFLGTVSTLIWLYLPFGVLAFFIRIGD